MRNMIFAAACAAAAGLASVPAGAVPFSVTGGSFVVGAGYGTGNGQLDVAFTSLVSSNAPGSLNFDLSVGQTQSFLFGRATLNETCINGPSVVFNVVAGCGLGGDETDDLGVTALVTFASPTNGTTMVAAVTGAFVGPVDGDSPAISDFFIDFSPVTVAFGGTGSFVLDIGDLFFNSTGSITNGANITLTALPVPEPGMVGLFGLGAIALALGTRRRKA